MTALCGGGTSQPKAGHAAVVQYSAGLVASIFAAYDLAWLIPIIPLLSFAPEVLATFCAADPPTPATLTAAEANALLQVELGADFTSGLAKVFDIYLNAIWYDACECTAGSPTPFSAPTPPVGTAIFQPPVPPSSGPCESQAVHNYFPTSTNAGGVGPPNFHYLGQVATAFRIFYANTVTSGPGYAVTVSLQQFDSAGGTLLTSSLGTIAAGATGFVDIPADPRFNSSQVTWTRGAGSGTNTLSVSGDKYCNGNPPGGVLSPCCPPDLATQATLDIILKQLNILQRQLVPFAYIQGTAHSGLSGAGSFAIQGLLGVLVNVTTLPGTIGSGGTSPTEYFDMGWITFGTPDGWPSAFRLERSAQVMTPARCSLYTELAYDLAPGVVITVTELTREP